MTKRILIIGGLAFVIVVGIFTLGAVGATPSQSERAISKSERLTAAPAADSLNSGAYLGTYSEIKAHADEFAEDLPVPSANSLDDVGYAAAAAQGGTSTALLEFVMQYNARCDWYVAMLERRSDQTAKTIVNQIPRWSAFRSVATGGPVGGMSQRIAGALNNGDFGPLKSEVEGPACNLAAGIVPTPG